MKGAGEVTLTVSGALLERDERLAACAKRITKLEAELKDARRPKSRVLLIGGPADGDMQMYDVHHGGGYIKVLQPRQRDRVHEYYAGPESFDLYMETAMYRVTKVSTYDGDRWVGLYEGVH